MIENDHNASDLHTDQKNSRSNLNKSIPQITKHFISQQYQTNNKTNKLHCEPNIGNFPNFENNQTTSSKSRNDKTYSSMKNQDFASNFRPRGYPTNNIRSHNIPRSNYNNSAHDSLHPSREHFKTSNRSNNTNQSNFYLSDYLSDGRNKINKYSFPDNSRLYSRPTSTFHKYSTDKQSNIETFDGTEQFELLSSSRDQHRIRIDKSAITKIIERQRNDNNENLCSDKTDKLKYTTNDEEIGKYPIDISGKNKNLNIDLPNVSNENHKNNSTSNERNLNDNGRYSKLNLNKFSHNDNQFNSQQHHNNDLSTYNDNCNYSINKCENCRKLILQNEKAGEEIGRLKINNEKLQIEYDSLNNSNKDFLVRFEKMKLHTDKYESEIDKLNSEIDKYQSEIDKFKSENNEYELEIDKYQSQFVKFNTEINKYKFEFDKYKSENEKLRKQLQKLELGTQINWKPLGFANPKGYCYLNSVVQVLGSCEEFKEDIYDYEWISNQKTNDSIFVEGLFNLIKAIRKCNKEHLEKSLNIVQKYISEFPSEYDIYEFFLDVLTRVSNVVKTNKNRPPNHFSSLPVTLSENAKNNFIKFKNGHPGFVFDNFYGQLAFQTVCKICNACCDESFQVIKSLPLPVPKSKFSVTLNSCIDLFLEDSDVIVDEPLKCECPGGSTSLKSITKLTHGPKYLFIYLIRGSYIDDGEKINTFVTCDDLTIDVKTLENKSIKYKLISVIDHVGDSANGHYYCKCCFETGEWWKLNDSDVEQLTNTSNIVTNNTIVFIFKITP